MEQKYSPKRTGGMLESVRTSQRPVFPGPLDTALGFEAFDKNLRARRGIANAVVKMPWERWPFSMAFTGAMPSSQKLLVNRIPPALPDLPAAEEYIAIQLEEFRKIENHVGFFRAFVQRAKRLTFQQMQDNVMQSLMQKAVLLLETNLHA